MSDILKAGAIILSNQDPSKIVLIYRAKHHDWSFPKGHIESGESVIKTTIREIEEETGLLVELIGAELPSMEYNLPEGDHVVVSMFLTRSIDDTKLRPEHDRDEAIWVDVDEVLERLSYKNAKEYFSSVLPIIKQAISQRR